MQAIAILKTFVSFVGAKVAVAMNIAASAQATMAIGSAVIAGSALVAKKAMSLFEVKMSVPDTDRSRQSTVKSASEPQKIIYGEALVSGPISFIGLGGVDNKDLYQTIVLAGHEVNAITDVYFDDFVITNTQINSGNTAGGAVNAGAFQTKNNVDIVTINKYRGTNPQTADQMFVGQFGNYTNDHRGDGIAYLAMKWVLNGDSAKTWDKYAPRNVKALVQGKKVYDPRLEVTAGGDAGDSPNNSSYIAYSDNPALCAIDYLMDQNVGLSVPSSKIDWSAVITAANGCDATVTVPGGTEKTFTCNGVVFATDTHQKNINKILSSMNGSLVYSNGKYVLRAGIYANPTVSLNEDDLIGSITVKTSIDRSERVNTIKGLFLDPSQGHKMVEFPKVQLSTELQRDNDVVMEKETSFAMTNTSYMAQRLAHKIIKSAGQQKVITFPANYTALNVTAGDRVQVSIDELSWVNKEFICVGWVFSEDGGVLLTLREDSSDAYSNPTSYSQVSGTGTITDASRGVPSPSGLQVESAESKIFLNWVNPTKPSDFNTIEVWASATNVRSDAVNIGETNGTQFTHDQSNSAITYAVGDTLYYWVRAKKNVGDATDTDAVSGYFPATTTSSANVTVTAAAVDWDNVANPTIGIDINSDTISINTGAANTTTGQDVATSGIEAGTTVTQGGITMNQGGSIKGGQSAYNTGTGFFLGYDSSAYKFSIGNSSNEALTFDGTNLAVTGDITATSGTFTGTVNASAGAFTGDVSTDSKFIAGSGDATTVVDGGTDATYRIFSGAAEAESENAPFQVKPDGSVFAKNITVFDASGNILLNQDGLGAAALAGISLTSGTAVDKVSGVLSGDGGEMTLTLDQTATVTLETKFAIYDNSVGTLYFYGSGATEAAAKSDITNSTLNIIYSLQTDGGSYSTAATKPITFTSTDSTPSSTEIYVTAVYIAGGIQEYRSILMDAGGALEYIANTNTYGATAYVVTSHTFTNLPAGVHKVKLSSTIAGSGSPSAAGQSTSNRLYELRSSAVNFVESAANVFANGTPSVPTGGGTVSGDLVVTGDLTVQGTTTTINVADLTVADKDITLNFSTGDSSSTANNAGIIIQDAVDASTDASILWKTASDTFEFSHPVKDLSLTGDLISDSSIYLRSAGGVAGVYLQDTSGGSASTAFRLYSDVDSTAVNIDTGGSQTIAAFVNNGNLLITGTIFADGAASNSLQWETGYDYSQIGHLPLAGGTLTGSTKVKPSTVSSAVTSSNADFIVEATEGQIQVIAEDGGDWASNIVMSNVNATGPAYRHYWLHNAPSTASANAGKFELRTSTTSTGGDIGGQGSGSTALLVVEPSGLAILAGGLTANGTVIVDGGTGVASSGVFHIRQSGDTLSDGITITSSSVTSHRIWKNEDGIFNIGPAGNADAFQQDLSGNVTIEGDISTTGLITSGFFLSGQGSAASPAIKVGDTDSGFYDAGGNMVGLALGGVLEYQFTTTQLDMKSNDLVAVGTISSTVINTGDATLLTLHHDTGSDIAQQKSFIDFSFEDDNTNETPQVRFGAEVGQNGDADSQIKEGSGAFVVYTNNATTVSGAATGLSERFRVDYTGDTWIKTGRLIMGSTAVIDTSRNLTNIGDITASGLATVSRLKTGLGSEGTPAIQVGDVDSGFWDSGANEIGVSLSGVLEYEFTPSQLDLKSNNLTGVGTISSGAITSSGSITASGNVLIGQDSGDSFNSDSMLRIQRAGDRVFQQFKCDADQNIQILFGDVDDDVECSIQYYPANQNLVFATGNNNDALTLDSSQNATFAGTISSGAITSTGELSVDIAAGLAGYFNSGTQNVVARFVSEDADAWLDLQDSDSGTYGVLIGHDSTNLLKIADQGVNVRMSLSNSGLLNTAKLSVTSGDTDGLVVNNGSATGAGIRFSDQTINGTGQQGYLQFFHINTLSYGKGAAFVVSSTEAMAFVVDGQLQFDTLAIKGSAAGNADLVMDSSGNMTNIGTIASGAITSTGNFSLNRSDGFAYLSNIGTGNSGIYVRGIGSSGTLRSHSTTDFKWEVSGSQKMDLNSSGVLNAVGGYQTNGTTVIDSSRNAINLASVGIGTASVTSGYMLEIKNINEAAILIRADYDNVGEDGNAIIKFSQDNTIIESTIGLTDDNHYALNHLYAGANILFQFASVTKFTMTNAGDFTATGNVTAYSDERLKENIQTLDGSKVLQMRGVSFTKDGKTGSGVIAQELELIASELVHTADDEMGTKSVAYGNLVGYLIENAKQQQAEIDELKSLIKTLLEK
jgi:hypothetical protein